MRFMKWIGFVAAVALAIACLYPWVFIESKNITVSGIQSAGTSFGKPGYLHFLLIAFFLFFHFIPKVWAKRSNLLIVALNLAWAIRNYILISFCQMGECPVKKTAFYILIPASVLMLAAALFPDIDLPNDKSNSSAVKI
ncbi:MAG TPA: hypothetical protein VHD35_06695 [Chitinophagaceae bacterium]|nr:hypothetical protein [Chitinophagaceae bacterium]